MVTFGKKVICLSNRQYDIENGHFHKVEMTV